MTSSQAPELGAPSGPFAQRWLLAHPRMAQLVSFAMVGGMAFVVDVGVYNVLRASILDDKPIGAKVISVAVATLASWIGNRSITFRATRGSSVAREGVLFALMNLVGLGIAAACLFVSHYVLGFTSQIADNIAGNGVGLVLGMAFRFFAYRFLVFRGSREEDASPEDSTDASNYLDADADADADAEADAPIPALTPAHLIAAAPAPRTSALPRSMRTAELSVAQH